MEGKRGTQGSAVAGPGEQGFQKRRRQRKEQEQGGPGDIGGDGAGGGGGAAGGQVLAFEAFNKVTVPLARARVFHPCWLPVAGGAAGGRDRGPGRNCCQQLSVLFCHSGARHPGRRGPPAAAPESSPPPPPPQPLAPTIAAAGPQGYLTTSRRGRGTCARPGRAPGVPLRGAGGPGARLSRLGLRP